MPPELVGFVEIERIRLILPVHGDLVVSVEHELFVLQQFHRIGYALIEPFAKPVEDEIGWGGVRRTTFAQGEIV